jgi:hypothetical protein
MFKLINIQFLDYTTIRTSFLGSLNFVGYQSHFLITKIHRIFWSKRSSHDNADSCVHCGVWTPETSVSNTACIRVVPNAGGLMHILNTAGMTKTHYGDR